MTSRLRTTRGKSRWPDGWSPVVVSLALLLAWAPLPFGSITPLWSNVLAAASLGLLAVYLIVRRRTIAWPPHGNTALNWAAGFFALTIAWALVQIAPFTPLSWHHPAWAIASQALDVPVESTVSINPSGAPAALLSLLGTAAIFVVALYEGRNSSKARQLLEAIAIIGLLYAVYGLVIYLSGNEWVAWAEKRYYPNSLSSTFVNRNTYGVFAGLGTLCAIALLVSAVASFLSQETRRADRLPALMSYLTGKGAIWLLATLVGTSALLLTGSRAANAAGLLGFTALLLIYLSARRTSITTISLGILLSLVIGFSFVLLSGDFLFDRLEQADGTLGGRSQIYELVVVAISDHIWLGSGYGSFEDIFRLYAGLAPQFGPNLKSAHSIFLELTLELGLPVAMSFFASVSICVGMCAFGVFKRRRDRIFPALAIAATLLVALQGAVDFAVQTPAVAGIYAALLGIGVAQSTSSAKSHRR